MEEQKDLLLNALEQCRTKVKQSNGGMSKPRYFNHDSLGESVVVEIDKSNSQELKAVLEAYGLQYDCDLTGSFMDFYSIKLGEQTNV